MTQTAPVEVRFRPNSVAIASGALFDDPSKKSLRDFLARAFSLPETKAIILRPGDVTAEIRLRPHDDGVLPLRRLANVLKGSDAAQGGARPPTIQIDADSLTFDDDFNSAPIRITRTGQTLSTWQVREVSPERIRISHPKLSRRDITFRLQDELAAIHGVTGYHRTFFGFVVDIDANVITAEQFIATIERSWPQLLRGFDPPAFPAKLVLSAALLTAAATAQYAVPALIPFVLGAAVVYGFPNVLNAIRQLRRGEVGLPVLYATGLFFMIWTQNPLSSAIMAVFMQSWPRLAEVIGSRIARTLFLNQRRKVVWARKRLDGADVAAHYADLVPGDVIVVRTGEYIAADGRVEDGLAAVDEDMLTGVAGAIDKSPGDRVYASTFVRAGEVVIRVTSAGEDTSARIIAAHLPRGPVHNVPSSAQADYIAHRNAKPALALAAASMFATRVLRSSQALIRPDYATGPRLSAQLSSLTAISTSARHGIFVRTHSAIDRLLAANVYVFDETANLSGRTLTVAGVQANARGTELHVLKLAAAAFVTRAGERAVAMREELARRGIVIDMPAHRRRIPGAIRFDSDAGEEIDVASTAYIARANLPIPGPLVAVLAADLKSDATADADPSLRSVWVMSEGQILGVVRFERSEVTAPSIISKLAQKNTGSQFIYLTGAPQGEAEALAKQSGIDAAYGGLSADDKAEKIRSLSRRAVWLGDGARPDARASQLASAVSVSTGGLASVNRDTADVVLLLGNLNSLVDLRQISNAHLARLRADYRKVYLCNIAAAAGGIVAGFGSLQSGLASNFGTSLVFGSRWFELKAIVDDLRARDAVRASTRIEELPPLELAPDEPGLDGDVVFDIPEAEYDLVPINGI